MSKLRATHLAKAYKKRQVISDLSIEVESGQIVGLLGPNGAGKTTAFYMIVGLVPPDAGTVTIDDRDITHLAMHQRALAGIGYLPQEASVFRKLTVEDNVMAILETRDLDETARAFATRLATGTLSNLALLDERIRSRAEHWRISRMAVVDRNILRLAVYEFLYEPTPRTVAINEALEIARRFSTYEATQFINGILDAIKRDLDEQQPQQNVRPETEDGD